MGGDRTSDKSSSKAGHGKGGPKLSEDGKARAADRQARRAEALRANLKKRKAQTRGRGDGGAE